MSYPFGPQAPGADKVAADLAEMINWMVHQPFFTVAEVLPLATARVRRAADAAFLLRALADTLDPSRAAMPVVQGKPTAAIEAAVSSDSGRLVFALPGRQVLL